MSTPTIETLTALVTADAIARAEAIVEELAGTGRTSSLSAGDATASGSRRVVADILRRAMGGGVIVGAKAAALRDLQATHGATLESAHLATFTERAIAAAAARGWSVPSAEDIAANAR